MLVSSVLLRRKYIHLSNVHVPKRVKHSGQAWLHNLKRVHYTHLAELVYTCKRPDSVVRGSHLYMDRWDRAIGDKFNAEIKETTRATNIC